MSFSGFSEEDIRKLSKTQDVSNIKTLKGPNNKIPAKKVTFKPNNTTNSSRAKKNLYSNVKNNIQAQELPEGAKLSTSMSKINGDNKAASIQNHSEQIKKSNEVEVVENPPEENQCENQQEQKKFRDLDEFEARQKLMEEQNRKRKELLAKALADRTKRTQEEAERLSQIQVEFKQLDAILSGDVKILRKQIELASIEYTECQKKYQRIEKEFLDAKLLLHQKKEKKEMLTEHLCTIIEKNEERKAEKLNELLQKLDLRDSGNDDKTVENGIKSNNETTS